MKFFSYGIFILDGVGTNRRYATVQGYATIGSGIVIAVKMKSDKFCLSGSIMDITEEELEYLDRVEGANSKYPTYKRILIKTTSGKEAFMYVHGGSEVKNLAYVGGRKDNEKGIKGSNQDLETGRSNPHKS